MLEMKMVENFSSYRTISFNSCDISWGFSFLFLCDYRKEIEIVGRQFIS